MWAYKRQVKINPINCKISITVNYITTRKEKCQSLISKKSCNLFSSDSFINAPLQPFIRFLCA